MKLSRFVPRSVTLLVLIPVLTAGAIAALLSVRILDTNISSYLEERARRQLELAAYMAVAVCDENFADLLSMRLAHDNAMVRTMKNDAEAQILDLTRRFPRIHFAILEEGSLRASTLRGFEAGMIELPPIEEQDSLLHFRCEGESCSAMARYFPLFRWRILSIASDRELYLPLTTARRAIYLSLAGIGAVLIGTLILVFSFGVRRPLKKLVEASSRVAREDFTGVATQRRDELGTLMRSFNSMVEELEKGKRRQEEAYGELESSQKRLQASLQEKEVLLQEIHHRVKNNLNIVVSLLSLQSDYVETVEDAKRALEVSRGRVYSMALVHERLYKSENLSHIAIKSYIESVVEDLKSLYLSDKRIEVRTELEDTELDITLAVPFGLILNELVTNALLHAFPEKMEGRVDIRFSCEEDGSCKMVVSDTGVGLSKEEMEEERHLGITLIKLLSSQLGANLSFDTQNGTRISLSMPRQ